jgi:enamine deaminase RidA (YjgF/YER057c/UK114 family)
MHHAPERSGPGGQRQIQQTDAGLHLARLSGSTFEEAFVTLPARPRESAAQIFQRMYDFIADHPRFRVVRQDVFGVIGGKPGHDTKAYRLNGAEWPVTWVEQGNGEGSPVAGIQLHAVSDLAVQPVRHHGRTVGVVYEDAAARYCVLAGLRPNSDRASRPAQARATLELMERVLEQVNMTFANVFRTWFFLDDILDWYGEFNRVRNEFFRERGVFDALVPASTGVGGSNADGTALVADLLAVAPKSGAARLTAVTSPLQCPALEYGSSFSRGVEISLPGQRRLYISGTASIHPDGRTAHVGDAGRQLELTMDVVEAILRSRGMDWGDCIRGIGYFKHMQDAPTFERWRTKRRLPPMPVILTKNDICRDDLLFELELDAARLD